jgi:hypothetical protein
MIIAKDNFENGGAKYHVIVHEFDGDKFCTMYKDGSFIHKNDWNEAEKELAEKMIADNQ